MVKQTESKEVTWKALDIQVYGTMTVPAVKEAHPAIVFVAGSGPTDRDWCSPLLPGTNGSAKLLAEALAKQGFASLRYDKLASGPHVKENIPKLVGKISMQSHLEELRGAVETLLAQKNIDGNSLFVFTNSEGAIHAVNYQLQTKSNRFKGLVLTGAPGRAIGELARSQIFEQIKNLPNAEIIMKPYDDAIAEFLANKPMTIDPSLPEGIRILLQSLETPVNLPFARELWMHRLSDSIEKVNEPILVVIGKKDIQVDYKIDGKRLENAVAGKANVSFAYPENANHVLKHEEKPREVLISEGTGIDYNASDAVLDTQTVEVIVNWLKKQITV
jgi:alpha-beta hydrolase superfamily lysophospholipase